jgi:two-component system, NarL family, response regulator DegU
MKLRILVADDNALFLQKLVSILEVEFEILAKVADGRAAVEAAHKYNPDVAVLDLEMPHLNGIEVARELAQWQPSPRVLICSVETDPEIVDASFQAGALGYVFKARLESDLLLAVKSVAQGQKYISSDEH